MTWGALNDGSPEGFYSLNVDGTVSLLPSGSVETVCPECYVVGGSVGSVKLVGSAKNWLYKSLESPRIGHRLFAANRKNGSWNTGKFRFGWSGKNGSDVYSLMVRYKGSHYPPPNSIFPTIRVTRPR